MTVTLTGPTAHVTWDTDTDSDSDSDTDRTYSTRNMGKAGQLCHVSAVDGIIVSTDNINDKQVTQSQNDINQSQLLNFLRCC